ncbi:hypothetical protein SAPIO_CDS1804 [Scedosporium apiospermum]|uniref:Heterokaryon incompatibility domain-containing protein n=1 Tax=Pseudallescheria apiosperma TaxID=563466 RepID=A0A084GDS4_PSEDA|nr:uncharacterized protein SAPIO_CDS1804 [Scedosporium apiospermum]KEZ45486.1 hypothetical protein SAPIO_CDS1804 [Scedosporium apiospermum]
MASQDKSFNLFQPPIRCSLVVKDLREDPVYDALSYTWGDPCTLYSSADEISPPEAWSTRAFDILVNEKPVSLATNLYTALLSFHFFSSQPPSRTASRDIYRNLLWIDALCINQSDVQERNSQVQMMSRIYRQSTTVFVWLGGGDRFSKQAILNLDQLFNVKLGKAMLERMKSLDILKKATYKELGLALMNRDSWIGIYMFLSRAWFQRAWVVQEIAFAKNAVALCGMIQFNMSMIIGSRANPFRLEADKRRLSLVKVSRITRRIEFASSELKGLAEFLHDIPESSVVPCPRSMNLDDWEKLSPKAMNEQKKLGLHMIMAILILLCETDNLIMEDTGNFQEPLDRFLNYEQARGEVGQYYTELQKILGQQAVVDGEIDFPPEFVRFETVRASSV